MSDLDVCSCGRARGSLVHVPGAINGHPFKRYRRPGLRMVVWWSVIVTLHLVSAAIQLAGGNAVGVFAWLAMAALVGVPLLAYHIRVYQEVRRG